MTRYGDSNDSKTRLCVGKLSSRTRSRDLERIFRRYGRVLNVEMKRDYAFVEFSGPRDADDARYNLDGTDVDGRIITVEFSRDRCGGKDHKEKTSGNSSKKLRGYHYYPSSPVSNPPHGRSWGRRRSSTRSPSYRPGLPDKIYSPSPVMSSSPLHGRSRSRSSRSRNHSRSSSPANRRGGYRRVEDSERRQNHSSSHDNDARRRSPGINLNNSNESVQKYTGSNYYAENRRGNLSPMQ